MDGMHVMRQEAPFPEALADLVQLLHFKAGWQFYLIDTHRGQGSKGLTLVINITGPDAYHPERLVSVNHYMIVPAASYDRRSWRRWLFEQIGLVDDHERCEHFMIGEDRPYAPSHGPGNDPYLIREVGTLEDQQTSFRGELNPPRVPGQLNALALDDPQP